MKNIFIFFILLSFCISENLLSQNAKVREPAGQTRAQIRAARKAGEAAAVTDCMAHKNITVVIDRIYPLKGQTRNSTDGYTLKLVNDTLTCYLPYFGEMRSAVFSGGLAISSENQKVNVVQQYDNSTESYLLQFKFTNKEMKDLWNCTLQIFKNGKANIRMEGSNRDAIAYSGNLKIPRVIK